MTDEEIDEIFKGCLITYTNGNSKRTFPTGSTEPGDYVNTSRAIKWHIAKYAIAGPFVITKIELTEENRRKLNEWINEHIFLRHRDNISDR